MIGRPEHRQHAHRVRLEWGVEGGALLAADFAVVVVVDVLSFCTAVDVAVGRGAEVAPAAHGRRRRGGRGGSRIRRRPARSRAVAAAVVADRALAGARLTLASPNGATLCAAVSSQVELFYISPKTVEQHVARLRQKLAAATRADLVAALRARLG